MCMQRSSGPQYCCVAGMQVDADSSLLRGKLGEMLNSVLGRQAHRAELAAWFSVSNLALC